MAILAMRPGGRIGHLRSTVNINKFLLKEVIFYDFK